MKPSHRLALTVVALATAVTVVSAPAASAEPAPDRLMLECDQVGTVAVDVDAAGTVTSRTPGVEVVAAPRMRPAPLASRRLSAAPHVSCRAPGAAGTYAVVLDASGTASPAAAQQAAADAAEAAAAGVAFPFQAELAAYLAGRSGSVTVSAQALGGRRMVYTRGEASNITASIVKVQIMATVMRRAQERGRALTSWEKSRLVPMIEVSDNDAASDLWSYVGGGSEVARVDGLLGLTSTHPSASGSWGLTTTTAPDNVTLMNRFATANAVLSDANRAYGLSLMHAVTSSQHWGVSAGPPAGTVDLKNGWLPRTDGWHVNSIGFSTSGPFPYTIAVLTHSTSASMATQVATIEGVSRIVWRHAADLRAQRGDWDQDGTTDLLGVSETGQLRHYPGAGTGALGAPTAFGSGWDSMKWVGSPGDVNGDGRSDLLAVNGVGLMYLYLGTGVRAFGAGLKVGNGWGAVTAIATVQDFDGNGSKDLLVRLGDGTLWQYSIATTGKVARVRQVGKGWNGMLALLGCRDFTGDGRGDLLAVGKDGRLTPYVSTGTGLSRGVTYGRGWEGVRAVAVPGDLTGDGFDDVVALWPDASMSVYPGRTGGSLAGRLDPGATGTGVSAIL